jgi:hypothetical protein
MRFGSSSPAWRQNPFLDGLGRTTVQVNLGIFEDGAPAIYDLHKVSNPHICAIGMSGAGKTHTIRNIIHQLSAQGATIIALDGQGDLSGLPNTVDTVFLAGGRSGSVNPLRVEVDADIQSGAVLLAIRNVITVVRKFVPSLGIRQEADLHKIIEYTYQRFGILDEDPSTWAIPSPTMKDVLDDLTELRHKLQAGMDEDVFKILRKTRARILAAEEKEREDLLNKERENLSRVIASLVDRGLDGTLTDQRFELRRIEALEHVINGIVRTGLFNGDDLRIRRGCINRFDLNKLHQTDMAVMYHLLLDRIFHAVRRNCVELNPRLPSVYVVLDEGKLASSYMEDLMSPLNRIATEGRKFGLALIMGVQSPKHLSDDSFENFGMTLLLKINHNAQDRMTRLFRIPESVLQAIEPRQSGLYSVNGARFHKIYFSTGQTMVA